MNRFLELAAVLMTMFTIGVIGCVVEGTNEVSEPVTVETDDSMNIQMTDCEDSRLTEQGAEYFEDIQAKVNRLSEYDFRLSNFILSAADDPLVILDTGWTQDVGANIGGMLREIDAIEATPAPVGVQGFHETLLIGVSIYKEGIGLLGAGIEAADGNLIATAGKVLLRGAARLKPVMITLDDFCG